MPHFRRSDSHIIRRALIHPSSSSLLAELLQRHLVALTIIHTRELATIPSSWRSALLNCAAESAVKVAVASVQTPRANVCAGGLAFAEKRTLDSTARGRDGEACLAARPDCDVGRGVEKVLVVAEGVDVGNADDGGDGSSAYGQFDVKESACRNDSHCA